MRTILVGVVTLGSARPNSTLCQAMKLRDLGLNANNRESRKSSNGRQEVVTSHEYRSTRGVVYTQQRYWHFLDCVLPTCCRGLNRRVKTYAGQPGYHCHTFAGASSLRECIHHLWSWWCNIWAIRFDFLVSLMQDNQRLSRLPKMNSSIVLQIVPVRNSGVHSSKKTYIWRSDDFNSGTRRKANMRNSGVHSSKTTCRFRAKPATTWTSLDCTRESIKLNSSMKKVSE